MKTVKVVAAVIRKNNKVFATARGYGKYRGWWEFPGGKTEASETPKEALIREIREELTAEISVGSLIKTIEYDYPDFHLSMNCYWAKIRSGELVPLEAADVRWLSRDELDDVKWLPADLELIETIKQELSDNRTLNYYEENAESFIRTTIDVQFSDIQKRFTSKLPDGGYILDFGCGSGRDTKAFLASGYRVDAIDGSEHLCRMASEYTGIKVRHMMFSDLNEKDKYDGIWACSSILHLPGNELKDVFEKMILALKPGGIIYTSFKYGEFEGYREGRYYTDFKEESFKEFISDISGLELIESWLNSDVRPGREDEKWLNTILKKN